MLLSVPWSMHFYMNHELQVFLKVCQTKLLLGKLLVEYFLAYFIKILYIQIFCLDIYFIYSKNYPLCIIIAKLAKNFQTCLQTILLGLINLDPRYHMNDLTKEE